MWIILLEALGALGLLLGIVWWTMVHKSAAQKEWERRQQEHQ